MSDGEDEKLTASQLESGLREAGGKRRKRGRGDGGAGVEEGLPPDAEPFFDRWGLRCIDVGVNWAVICGLCRGGGKEAQTGRIKWRTGGRRGQVGLGGCCFLGAWEEPGGHREEQKLEQFSCHFFGRPAALDIERGEVCLLFFNLWHTWFSDRHF